MATRHYNVILDQGLPQQVTSPRCLRRRRMRWLEPAPSAIPLAGFTYQHRAVSGGAAPITVTLRIAPASADSFSISTPDNDHDYRGSTTRSHHLAGVDSDAPGIQVFAATVFTLPGCGQRSGLAGISRER